MSGKKTTGRKSTAKSTSRSSAAKTARAASARSEADKEREREQKKNDRADAAVAGNRAKKDARAGRAAGEKGEDGFDPINGRYRDELVETDPTNANIIVRRTFLASKTEFEVEVPKAVAGKTRREIENLKRGERDKIYKEAAKSALDARTEGLSKEIDNSDLGGKHIGQPKGGGTFNPENPNAPHPSPGEPGAGSLSSAPSPESARSTASQQIPRKGQGAPTTTGAPIREPSIAGSANDRTTHGDEVTRVAEVTGKEAKGKK